MATNKLEILITLKDRFTRGMQFAGKSLTKLKGSIDRIKRAVFSLQGAFVALGVGMISRGFLAVAMSFERFETILKTVTGSAVKAKDSMVWITEFTAKTPYELAGVTDAFVKLVSYGFDPMDKSLKVLGDTAAGMAKPLIMAVEMFADAATGEFERLKEFGIRAKQQGDKVTFSWVENGKQMVKTAKKTQEGITTALIDIFEKKYAGAMDDLSKTVGGMWSNMADQFTLFQKAVMDAGLFKYIQAGLGLVLKKVDQLREEGKLDEWAKEVGEKIINSFKSTALGVASFYDVMAPIINSFKELFIGMWDWFKGLPKDVQKVGLIAFILAGKVGTKFLVVAIMDLFNRVDDLQKMIRAGVDPFKVRALKNEIKGLEESLKSMPDWSAFGVSSEFSRTTEEIKRLKEELRKVQKEKLISPIDADDTEKEAELMVTKVLSAFKTIEKEIENLSKVAPKIIKPPEPKAELAKPSVDLALQVQKDLLSLEVLYKKGEEELIAYLERRKILVLEMLSIEIKKLEEVAKAETDPGKRLKLEHSIFVKKQEYTLKEIELTKNITEAHEDAATRRMEVEGMLRDLRTRVNEELDSEQAAELAKMDERHQEELEAFKKLLDDKLAAELGYADKTSAIKEISRQQELEKDKLLAEQTQQTWNKRLELAGAAATGLKGIFEDLYELGGKKSKSMFKLMKKAAIAEAFINTAKAVTGALGTPPYGLGAIATATLIALKGGLEIAKIKAREMAEGGLVEGVSSHSKADNINIKGTAGEFMQPVSAVKYYGKRVMEGIRNNIFPKELFGGFQVPVLAHSSSGSGYAEGGAIINNNSNSDFSVSVPVNINDSKAADIAGTIQQEVEETVIRVMERELR